MIGAVFFDWFGTLARYEPPREVVLSRVLSELGYDAPIEALRGAFVIADRAWYEESIATTPEERAQRFEAHQARLLREAHVSVPAEHIPELTSRMRQASRQMTFVLFDDATGALAAVRQRGLTVGVLTNMRGDISPMCRQLGIEPYVDFSLTSGQAGAEKPSPAIFQQALERAGVAADSTIHVGDQYAVDVAGARAAGIAPILLDRSGAYPDVADCPRIGRLDELAAFLA